MTKQHKTSSEEIKEYSHSVCSASSIALCTITRANRVNLRSEHSVRMNVGFDQSGDTEGATLRQTTESSDKIRHRHKSDENRRRHAVEMNAESDMSKLCI